MITTKSKQRERKRKGGRRENREKNEGVEDGKRKHEGREKQERTKKNEEWRTTLIRTNGKDFFFLYFPFLIFFFPFFLYARCVHFPLAGFSPRTLAFLSRFMAKFQHTIHYCRKWKALCLRSRRETKLKPLFEQMTFSAGEKKLWTVIMEINGVRELWMMVMGIARSVMRVVTMMNY